MSLEMVVQIALGLVAFFGSIWVHRLQRDIDRLNSALTQFQPLERDLLSLKADLPMMYVRREDYIRGQTVIEAKLDALFNELKNVQLQGAQNGR